MSAKKLPPEPKKAPFQQVLAALLNEDKSFPPLLLYRFSDLEGEDLQALAHAWPLVEVRRRQAILEDLEELGEADTVLSFEALYRLALQDSDPVVRRLSVRGLWDYEPTDLIDTYLTMLHQDADTEVQAACASALGQFVYLGEIEEIPQVKLDEVVAELLETYKGKAAPLIRRRALEALGFSSHEEVPGMIESAYYSNRKDWVLSALVAMGRSANAQWGELVLQMLQHDDDEIRMEAARTAGELELKSTVESLKLLARDQDNGVRQAAIWSLSQIGGPGVADLLDELYEETDDDDELELIESAMDNLAFTEDIQLFSLLELDEEDGLGDDELFDEDYPDEVLPDDEENEDTQEDL
jgi:HEAT repeat protein